MQNALHKLPDSESFIDITSIDSLQRELSEAKARIVELTVELHTERVQGRACRNELMSVRSQMQNARRR